MIRSDEQAGTKSPDHQIRLTSVPSSSSSIPHPLFDVHLYLVASVTPDTTLFPGAGARIVAFCSQHSISPHRITSHTHTSALTFLIGNQRIRISVTAIQRHTHTHTLPVTATQKKQTVKNKREIAFASSYNRFHEQSLIIFYCPNCHIIFPGSQSPLIVYIHVVYTSPTDHRHHQSDSPIGTKISK
jgi:hypothetical protein